MPKSVTITQSQKKSLIAHAQNSLPNESCAILFGIEDAENVIISDIFLTENAEQSKTNFTISNEDLLFGYQEAERRRLQVVGIFHSHPDSMAYPSKTDIKFMEINPVVWVIFSTKFSDLRAYVLESNPKEITINLD
ncbi:MAG: M67 family metallopeptidase [Candidatus Nitrosotenuis sp.]